MSTFENGRKPSRFEWPTSRPDYPRILIKQILLAVGTLLVIATNATGELPEDHSRWSEVVLRGAYKLIASPDELHELDSIGYYERADYLRRFWKRRDPTPTTERNEFKEQFTERVDEALMRYPTVPTAAPWDERGEVYIKLGPPDDIVYQYSAWGSSDEYENWYYYGQNLRLRFQQWGSDYRSVPFIDFAGNVQSLARWADDEYEIRTSDVIYYLPLGVKNVDLAIDWYPFRRNDGSYDVYFVCAMPLKPLTTSAGWRKADLHYTARIVAFDSTLQSVWSDSVHVERHFDPMPRGMQAQNQWSAVLVPGFYTIAAEIADAGGTKHGTGSFDRWLVPYADSVELDLSPLVVAKDVRPATESSTHFVRNDREIVPMPGRAFSKDWDIAFYHEVYNLSPDSSGQCRYRVEYVLYDQEDKNKRVLFAQDFVSVEQQTFQAGKIPHEQVGKGSFILEVNTQDFNSGATRTALAQFRVK